MIYEAIFNICVLRDERLNETPFRLIIVEPYPPIQEIFRIFSRKYALIEGKLQIQRIDAPNDS